MESYGKYLSDLGIKYKNTPWGWDTKKNSEWKKQQKTFGCDNR